MSYSKEQEALGGASASGPGYAGSSQYNGQPYPSQFVQPDPGQPFQPNPVQPYPPDPNQPYPPTQYGQPNPHHYGQPEPDPSQYAPPIQPYQASPSAPYMPNPNEPYQPNPSYPANDYGDPAAGNEHGPLDDMPPSYPAAPAGEMPPPPTYDSLFGKVKAAKEKSDGNVDFSQKLVSIFCDTIGCTIALTLILAVPITMIVIGSLYVSDCPAGKMIPIYLIVGGSIATIKNLGSLKQRYQNRNKANKEELNSDISNFDCFLNCVLLGWFIAGNVFVYQIYDDWVDKPSKFGPYCNPVLYWFAFWVTTSVYVVIGLFLAVVFLVFCGACVVVIYESCTGKDD